MVCVVEMSGEIHNIEKKQSREGFRRSRTVVAEVMSFVN